MININDYIDEKGRFDNRYLLVRPLSTDGATADVWLALDLNTMTGEEEVDQVARMKDDEIEKLGLMVAIKIYRPQNALDIEGEQRFRDEYMIVFNCHHANLIHPTNYSICKGAPYLVLPYCRRGSSESLIGNQFSNEEIWKYVQNVASGLAYLHALNPPIVHQDVKPANVLMDGTGNYALTDFGISAQRGGVHGFYFDNENSGTLAYMAPERFQKDAEPLPQSDIWGFGATLCEVLTGRVPFGEEGGRAQAEGKLPIPKITGVSADVQRLIHDCLSLQPGDRPTAQRIADAARAHQYPLKSRKWLWILLSLLAALLLGCAGYFLSTTRMPEKHATVEERYALALELIETYQDDEMHKDSLKLGLELMDSLSNQRYIPAMFKISSILSSPEAKSLKELMVKYSSVDSSKYNSHAHSLLNQIIYLNDSGYANINATAAYRLGCYYMDEKSTLKVDMDEAYSYFCKSEDWMTVVADKSFVKKSNDIMADSNLLDDIILAKTFIKKQKNHQSQ